VQGAVVTAVGRPLDGQGTVFLGDLHPLADLLVELAAWAVDCHASDAEADRDAVGDLNWLFADSAHKSLTHQT
jgi:hypothetical protein